jgi:hypothetical protein
MERPTLESLSSRRPQVPASAVGVPEMLVLGFLTAGERFEITASDKTVHKARLLAHGAVELDGERYINLRQALAKLQLPGSFVTSFDCRFDRNGPMTLADIRRHALRHPDVATESAAALELDLAAEGC